MNSSATLSLRKFTGEPFSIDESSNIMKASDYLQKEKFKIWKLVDRYQSTHTHDYFQIWYIVKGTCKHRIDNHKFHLYRGDMIFIPPFSFHSMYEASDDLYVIGIDFSEDLFSESETDHLIMLQAIDPLFFRMDRKSPILTTGNNMESSIISLFHEYEEKRVFYDIIIKNTLANLMIDLVRTNHRNHDRYLSRNEHLITDTIKYIHSNYNVKITIPELCKRAGMSERLLSSTFKAVTGKTIMEYIIDLKIAKAKQLLNETDMQVIDISYELGFTDCSYFNKLFKKYVGISPNAYRKDKRK